MEEVDNIIIHSLRQIGCDIEEEINSLSQFSCELVVKAAVTCLETIQPGRGLPLLLPTNMALRFRVTASVAEACSDLGYRGDIGYQTFLYSNETDIRRVFMFLIEHLPKESDKKTISSEPLDRVALLERDISQTLAQQLSAPWLPIYCKSKGIRALSNGLLSCEGHPYRATQIVPLSIPQTTSTNVPQAFREYWVHNLRAVCEQVPYASMLIPSLHHHNALQLIKQNSTCLNSNREKLLLLSEAVVPNSTKNMQNDMINFSYQDIEIVDEYRPKLQENNFENKLSMIEEVTKDTECMKSEIKQIVSEIQKLSVDLSQTIEDCKQEETMFQRATEKHKITSHSYSLLENCDENVENIKASVDASEARLASHADQWEQLKNIWMLKYEQARFKANNEVSASQQAADSVMILRDRCRELTETISRKTAQHEQLSIEYKSANKEIKRSAYTHRILEIIANIAKQKADMERVLSDTRALQKEINTLSGRLERSFTVADELIFRDAKKDEYSRRAYKLLAMLHSDCSSLVGTVEATGAAVRESRELEEQLQTEQAKNVGNSLNRVLGDLQSMKHDSAQLIQQMKTARM